MVIETNIRGWKVRALAGFVVTLWASVAPARMVNLTLIHTTDLHGHLRPAQAYDGRDNLGGMLRVSSRIRSLRATSPNPILVDCGDVFQGTPESLRTRGLIMADVMNRLGYDAWVVGNHEFDWGLDALSEFITATQAPALGANLYTREGIESALPPIAPYTMLSREGIRIAVIGLTTPGIPSWSRPYLLGPTLVEHSVETLRTLMPRVKTEKPDLIFLLVHQGYRPFGDDHANEVEAIHEAFPEIDVILGGHTHQAIASQTLGSTVYAQAGYYGIWLGVMHLAYDTVAKKLVSVESTLEEMGPDIPDDPQLLDAWGTLLSEVDQSMQEVLTRAEASLCPETTAWDQSPIQQLICAAIAEAVDTDFVLHGALSPACLEAGPVTEADVWNLIPYENTIGVAWLTLSEIQTLLAEVRAGKTSIHRHAPYGFTYTIVDSASGETYAGFQDAAGVPLHPRKRYRVAMNSYVLASGGTRYPQVRRLVDQPIARLTMTGVDTRDAVRQYLRQHPSLDPETLMKGAIRP
ncbi:MAG: bifunctional metallophosphatase/5'-nucleotidase [Kiritimatiellae bacterium]|nr:bifunctional metallophosphatase/5'-nucleotidase [Kiritimatiellia bacterium]